MLRKSILVFLVLFSILLSLNNSYASIGSDRLSINTSNQTFLNLRGYESIVQLIDEGKLIFDFKTLTQTQLIKNGVQLAFQSPLGEISGTGVLEVSYQEIHRSIPVEIHIPQELSKSIDFSIFSSMPQHRLQEHALSCESSASADILSYILNKNISESEVIEKLPKSSFYNKIPEKRDIGTVWGNPNEGFVGFINSQNDITAKQKLMTGYGVYEGPIAYIYEQYGLITQIINKNNYTENFTSKEHLTQLLQEIVHGNGVQLWGDWCTSINSEDGDISNTLITNDMTRDGIKSGKNECANIDDARDLYWYYVNESGKYIQHVGLNGEHAFILLGWKGDIKNPTHIKVWDTNTGYHSYPIQEWMRKWGKMQYRSIIIKKLSTKA